MTLNIQELSDEELAALNYAIERYYDGLYEDGYNQEFIDVVLRLNMILNQEYLDRELHWSEFQYA